MKFDPSITDGALLEVFQRFIGITGYRLWRIRIEKLEREISRYPILENVIHNRHPIELEVAKWRRHYAIPWRSPPVLRGPTAYRLIAFMAMVERVHRESTPKAKTRISGMIKDALKRKLSFFSLEHEFRTAAHLMHKGFDVYFTDLEGNETFDFLIKRNMNEIEVECKTVSVDSGRKIHRHDFEELLKLIHEDLLKYVHDDNSNNVIFITAFDRLKIGSQEIKNIRRALQINFTSSADIMNDHFHIMNLPYTPSSLPPNFESVRTDIRNEIGDSFFHCLVFGNNERCLLLVVRSSQEDKVLRYIKNGLRKASDQFSKTKPANLSLFIEDIYPDQWESLRAESGLHYMTATYLSNESRRHIHSVSYSSMGEIGIDGIVASESGPVLSYRNPFHPQHDDDSLVIY